MLRTPHYVIEDPDEVRRLVRDNPWVTFVATTSRGLVASHYPVMLEADHGEGDISVVSHVGRPDDELLELGAGELLMIVQGPHGYVSPSWYADGSFIPTWNHVTAHLYGVPELLDAEENLEILGQLVDHFEGRVPEPRSLDVDRDAARRVARGTVGLRMRVTRFEARLKLSQNQVPEVRARIEAELRGDGHYAHPALADEMARVRSVAAE